MLLAAGFAIRYPADIAFIMALDLSTWVEAFVAVYAVTQVTKIRPMLMFARARLLGYLRRSPRQSRTRVSTSRKPPAKEDEPASALAFAV
jgi:hypothetical protein